MNWTFKVEKYLNKDDLKILSTKLTYLIDSAKRVEDVYLKDLPPLTLKTKRFIEHDDVNFNSLFGIQNSDTGRSDWEGEINYLEFLTLYSKYASKLKNSKSISNPNIIIKGLYVEPITQITNVPINYADVDYKIDVDGWHEIKKDNIEIALPEGHDSGQEWWRGLVQGVLTGLIAVGGWSIAGGIMAGAEAISLGMTEGLLAASIGLEGALTLGIGASVLTPSMIALVSSMKSTMMDSESRLSDSLKNLIRNYISDNFKDKVSTVFNEDLFRKVGNDFGKKVFEIVTKLKKEKSYFEAKPDNAYYPFSGLISNPEGKLIDQIEKQLPWLLEYEKSTKSNDLYKQNIRKSNIFLDRNRKVKIHSVLYGNGKSAEIWGDRSTYKMRGLVVSVIGDFEYQNISYDRINL